MYVYNYSIGYKNRMLNVKKKDKNNKMNYQDKKTSKEKMKDNLIREINKYYDNFLEIQDELDVLEEIIGLVKTENSILMKLMPKFSEIVMYALGNDISISLARLFDKSTKAKSIPALIKKISDNRHLFSNWSMVERQIDQFKQGINYDDTVEKKNNEIFRINTSTLMMRRDKIYAHNDNKFFGIDPQTFHHHFRLYEAREITKRIGQLLTFLLQQFDAPILDHKRYKQFGELKKLFLSYQK